MQTQSINHLKLKNKKVTKHISTNACYRPAYDLKINSQYCNLIFITWDNSLRVTLTVWPNQSLLIGPICHSLPPMRKQSTSILYITGLQWVQHDIFEKCFFDVVCPFISHQDKEIVMFTQRWHFYSESALVFLSFLDNRAHTTRTCKCLFVVFRFRSGFDFGKWRVTSTRERSQWGNTLIQLPVSPSLHQNMSLTCFPVKTSKHRPTVNKSFRTIFLGLT